MRLVSVSAIQMSCQFCDNFDPKRNPNIILAEGLVREAAQRGAQIILLPEFFATLYFCQEMSESYFSLARLLEDSELILHFSKIAKELQIVLPISFFERYNNAYYNSIAILDADGSICGVYRKTHIPDSPGYFEKFYFTPGDVGIKVWSTRYAKIGVGICWDQWFPEVARIMALKGAEILFYPTAIGSEPQDPNLHSMGQWTRAMQGHAACNLVPVVASNRFGTEQVLPQMTNNQEQTNIKPQTSTCAVENSCIDFYGNSFIADHTGDIVTTIDNLIPPKDEILIRQFDLDAIALSRTSWGVFRDRRPDIYASLLTKDGNTRIDKNDAI